jgi:hypothetical protein
LTKPARKLALDRPIGNKPGSGSNKGSSLALMVILEPSVEFIELAEIIIGDLLAHDINLVVERK